MVSINYSSREVCCKIVYYGPGLSGKTTNLQYVHAKVPGNTRGNLISLATEADRTLYFDFLPINIGTINGFAAKFQLYTVPGQVYYNATRKLVLRGVDGVVFVADSQPDKMDENIDSLANLEDNLREYGYELKDMPFVIQYNKRDLPGVMSTAEMDAKLNPTGVPTFEGSATLGNGVFDTLKMIIKLVLDKAKNSSATSAPSGMTAAPMTEPEEANELNTPAYGAPPSVQSVESEETGRVATPVAMSSSGATATAVAEPETETETEDDIRPYPGSTTQKVETKEKKLTPGAFSPNADGRADASMKNVVSNQYNGDSGNLATPRMAPPLKRKDRKKRGFFKKLFGIK
jgi:hypothetical protein